MSQERQDRMKEPTCSARNCKHLNGFLRKSPDDPRFTKLKCAAFPNGIPREIAYGDNLHLEPVEGDNGIQYEEGKPFSFDGD